VEQGEEDVTSRAATARERATHLKNRLRFFNPVSRSLAVAAREVVAMTESEWWSATEPRALDWLFFDALAADRKLRLFCVACCRRVEHLAGGAPFPFLIRLLESHADGLEDQDRVRLGFQSVAAWHRERMQSLAESRRGIAPIDEVEVAAQGVIVASGEVSTELSVRDRHWYSAMRYPSSPQRVVQATAGTFIHTCPNGVAEGVMVRLLHDIFGPLPFRDIGVQHSWLTSDVLALARGIYDEKAFDRMPILADALQDAGCDNDEILNHCREQGWEHVRGCWVIDLLLGRPWRETQ
jgi:hypothetical protein